MRNVWMAVILTGCVLGEQQTSWYAPTPQNASVQGRFDQLASTDNPGHGIVPSETLTNAWMGMGDRICEVRGNSGAIATDIFLDGDVAPGLVLLDGGAAGWVAADGSSVLVTDPNGGVVAEYDVGGDVLGGQITDDGIYVLVSNDDGCFVVLIAADGSTTTYAVDDEVCDPDTDVEVAADGGVLIGGGTDILEVTPVGVEAVADGSQVSADPTTEVFFTGTPGDTHFTAHHPDGTTALVGLPAGLVDFAARNGELIALTEDHRLVQIDTATYLPRAIEAYYGPLGMNRLQLTDNGRGIILNGWRDVQFYRLRNNVPTNNPLTPGESADATPGQAGSR